MAQITPADRRKLAALSRLAYCNPFSPERIAAEQDVLGAQFVADNGIAWSRSREEEDIERPNVTRITLVATELVHKFRTSPASQAMSSEMLGQYWDVVTYVLLYRHVATLKREEPIRPAVLSKTWLAFREEYDLLCDVPHLESVGIQSAAHLFACLCQVRRAFVNIYDFILGESAASVRLRRSVWESIFTNDLRRYRRTLYSRLGALPTLVTGPSGTGKELVARAIGLSQYVPFDESRKRFAASEASLFQALNLSALSATLIESELFGHRKGSFTGAVADRKGWLELCQPHGAIFLDEIGELEMALQVKLLRVVQQRTYSALGESTERTFAGKLIGATNRDLDAEMRAGRFRADLYYRLCADRVQTPHLREQLDDCPEDLEAFTLHISRRLAGDDAELLCRQAVDWIESHLGHDYPWPGNIRELEQCVSSILIRGEYLPATTNAALPRARPSWLDEIHAAELNADEVLQKYCTWIYFRTGSYEAAAKHLGLDRRTVKSRIDQAMLDGLKSAAGVVSNDS